jgi:hypothetical protein
MDKEQDCHVGHSIEELPDLPDGSKRAWCRTCQRLLVTIFKPLESIHITLKFEAE